MSPSSPSAAPLAVSPAASPEAMALAPPPAWKVYDSLEDLIKFVNTHASTQGYAVITARSKLSKKGIKRKVHLRCDRGGKSSGPLGRKRQHAGTRMTQCPFSIIAKLDPISQRWGFVVHIAHHNHEPTKASSHPALRKLAYTDEVKSDISRQVQVQTAPGKILSSLRLNADADEETSLFKARDLYNLKAKMRREALMFFNVQIRLPVAVAGHGEVEGLEVEEVEEVEVVEVKEVKVRDVAVAGVEDLRGKNGRKTARKMHQSKSLFS